MDENLFDLPFVFVCSCKVMEPITIQDAKKMPLMVPILCHMLPFSSSLIGCILSNDFSWKTVAWLILWSAWTLLLCIKPLFMSNGILRFLVSLFIGFGGSNSIGNKYARAVYYLATMMYMIGRTTAIASNSQLQKLPTKYRIAYAVNLVDISKAKTMKTEDVFFQKRNELMWQAATHLVINVASMFAMLMLPVNVSPFIKISFASLMGSIMFTSGLYLGGFAYQALYFLFADSPSSCLDVKPLMIDPVSAPSVSDFWAHRWDTGMQNVLLEFGYRPARAMGMSRGMAMWYTFFVSGIIHCVGLIPLGISWSGIFMMMSFFIIQAAYVSVEQALALSESNTRTMSLLLLSSPLFVLPFLRSFGLLE